MDNIITYKNRKVSVDQYVGTVTLMSFINILKQNDGVSNITYNLSSSWKRARIKC